MVTEIRRGIVANYVINLNLGECDSAWQQLPFLSSTAAYVGRAVVIEAPQELEFPEREYRFGSNDFNYSDVSERADIAFGEAD
ncbi:hypothetical protein [Pseudaminobacter sp. NGMCC 1.201702]|uniref:hypothetical protein n=1 Tax=Pseudaminobacter sp. NGMCC 1.201702 TaxID=3391825 RepID=UPI0039EEA4F1